jgi:hypothetical protein
MNKRLPFWLRNVMYNLRGGFLLRPLIIALTLGCAGALLSWLEETFPGLGDFVPTALFPSHSDPQVAQVILAGIASSIMTVVSIVFAILLMTLTLAAADYRQLRQRPCDAMDAGRFPGNLFLLHGRASNCAVAPAPVCARIYCFWSDVAGAHLCGLVAVLHSPHLASDQRQPYRRPDRVGNGGYN